MLQNLEMKRSKVAAHLRFKQLLCSRNVFRVEEVEGVSSYQACNVNPQNFSHRRIRKNRYSVCINDPKCVLRLVVACRMACNVVSIVMAKDCLAKKRVRAPK